MPRIAAILLAGAIGITAGAQAADVAPAAPVPPPVPVQDIEIRLTPFFWASGLSGTVGARRNLPTVDIDVSFRDILRNLDFAAMVAGEYRNGRWGILADLTYVAVSLDRGRDIVPRAPGFTGASLSSKTFTATATGFYRVYESPSFTADIVAGGRVWSISNDLDLSVAGIVPISAGATHSWIDPVAGVRLRAALGHGFGLSGYGDIGAGSSRLTWELRGTLDYAFNANWAVSVGYRHLAVDYRRGGFVYDTSFSGPIAGVSYRF